MRAEIYRRGHPVRLAAVDAKPVQLDYDWHEEYAISQAFRVGDVIYTSGQAAISEDGRLVGILSRTVLQRRLAEDEPPPVPE